MRKGQRHTEEAKEKISLKKKGQKLSEETKQKISNALKGKMPKNFEKWQRMAWKKNTGRKRSLEERQHISEGKKGKKPKNFDIFIHAPKPNLRGDKSPTKRPEVRKKISESKKGDKNPAKRPEVRKKISETMKKNPNRYWLEKHLSEETKEKIRRNHPRNYPKISSIEIKFQNALTEENVKGWIPQFPFQITLIDIAFPEKKIAIYIDGDYWHNLPNYKIRDLKINKFLVENGWKVIRFWEFEINNNIKDCINIIKEEFKK